MTLTLEPRLPKGCEADRFLGGAPSPVGRPFLRSGSRRWPWKVPGPRRAPRSVDSLTHLAFLLLAHSLGDCSGAPACAAHTKTALAKVTFGHTELMLFGASDTTAPSFLTLRAFAFSLFGAQASLVLLSPFSLGALSGLLSFCLHLLVVLTRYVLSILSY